MSVSLKFKIAMFGDSGKCHQRGNMREVGKESPKKRDG